MLNKSNLFLFLLFVSTHVLSATFTGSVTEVQECSGYGNCDIQKVTQSIPCSYEFVAKYKSAGVSTQANFRGQHSWSINGPELGRSTAIVDGVSVRLKKKKRPYMLHRDTIAYSLESRNYTTSVLFENSEGQEILPIEFLLSRKVDGGKTSTVYKCEF